MKHLLIATLVFMFVAASVAPAPASSSYTIDQIQNSPATFTVNDMTNAVLTPTSSTITFRLNYTTTSNGGLVLITPSTIAGSHNNFNPTNIQISCSKTSGSGTFTGFNNVQQFAGSSGCGTMPANSSGTNIIVQMTITIDDTALAPAAFSADTYSGSLTISAIDG